MGGLCMRFTRRSWPGREEEPMTNGLLGAGPHQRTLDRREFVHLLPARLLLAIDILGRGLLRDPILDRRPSRLRGVGMTARRLGGAQHQASKIAPDPPRERLLRMLLRLRRVSGAERPPPAPRLRVL